MDLNALFTSIDGQSITNQIFINASQQQAQLETLSSQALSKGIDLYQEKKYEDAAKEFQRSFGITPNSSFSADAAKYLSMAYEKTGKTDKAVEALKSSFRYHPENDDLHTELGNLLFSNERYDEALTEYKEAVRINPNSNNHYSLGQGYLKTEKYNEAETEFNTVLRMEPGKPNGDFGLGLTYNKKGEYKEAIESFEEAIRKKKDFYDAYAEIGYAYADMGNIKEADELVEFLEGKDENLSTTLNMYINKVEPPKILFAWSTGTFSHNLSVNTSVASFDPYLENAGASQTFTMKFQFNKEMDRSSIENRFNWAIEKGTGYGPGEAYNFGMPVPDTEITIGQYPDSVLYDADTRSATINFTITQNETADGTLDPSHIKFKFNGEDTDGIKMSSDFDEYSGFSGIA